MTTLEALRAANTQAISEDPVEVAIHRVAFVDDGAGGRLKEEATPAPFVGRVYTGQGRGGAPRILLAEAGGTRLAPLGLLAPWDADVRAGSNVEDTFEAAGRRYRVRQVIPRLWRGETYALHCVLEEVA